MLEKSCKVCLTDSILMVSPTGGGGMLEVVFTDSEKGAMKVAKNYNEKQMLGGAVGYIGKKPTKVELKKHFEGQAVGGNSNDVVHIGFSLDIGDITGTIDGNQRQAIYKRLWGRFDIDPSERERFFRDQRQDMEVLMSAAKRGMPIRIWKSNAPYSICGFYFVCNCLRDIDCKISLVSLPDKSLSEYDMMEYNHWGEVAPGKFYQFLPLEKQLSQIEKKWVSDCWQGLMNENGSLRAVVNGKLISVPEDFYDFILTRNLPEEDFVMARLIGKLLGEYSLGISDSWYALRIDQMIAENKLIVIDDLDKTHPYGKVLRRMSS